MFSALCTSDVAQAQLVEGQNDGGGFGFPRGHTLLPGQVVLPRVPNKLDAFWDRNLHVDLWKFWKCHLLEISAAKANWSMISEWCETNRILDKNHRMQIIHSSKVLAMDLIESNSFSSAILQVFLGDAAGAGKMGSVRRKHQGRWNLLGGKNPLK